MPKAKSGARGIRLSKIRLDRIRLDVLSSLAFATPVKEKKNKIDSTHYGYRICNPDLQEIEDEMHILSS
jgi:hypothetical protein